LIQWLAREHRQHTQHFVARDEGMGGDAADALSLYKLGSREVQLLLGNVSDQHGLPCRPDMSNDVSVQWEPPEETMVPPILPLRMEGRAGASDEMKAPGAIAAFLAQEA